MGNCKSCGSVERIKNGNAHGKQRYQCKSCGKTYVDGDKRNKYSKNKRLKVIKMYLEGVGIRSIERLEGVSNPLIISWIRKFAKQLQGKLKAIKVPEETKDIQIIELDELFSYCQKKTKKIYIWLAVDRVRNKVVDFEVTAKRDFSEYIPMALRLKEDYNI